MTAMEVLEYCRQADSELRRLVLRIRQRRDAAACISPKMDDIGGGRGSGPKDKLAENVADIDRLMKEYSTREEWYTVELAAACVLLDTLPENISSVLHRYYIKRDKITAIAAALGFTEGYVRRLKCDGEERLMKLDDAIVANALPAWYLKAREGATSDA